MLRYALPVLAPLLFLACSSSDDAAGDPQDSEADGGRSATSSSGSVDGGKGASTSSSGGSSGALPDGGGSSGTGIDDGGAPDADAGPPSTSDDVLLTAAEVPASSCFDGWCWDSVSPTGTDLTAALGFEDGTAIVAGAGTVMTFDGTAWHPEALPTDIRRARFAGSSIGNVWIATDQCEGNLAVFWHRVGTTWTSSTNAAVHCTLGSGFSAAWTDTDGSLFVSSGYGTYRLGADGSTTSWSLYATSMWGTGTTVYAVFQGQGSSLLGRIEGDDWLDYSDSVLTAPGVTALHLGALAGTGPDDIWLTNDHAVLHFDGQSWTSPMASSSLVVDSDSPLVARFPGEVQFLDQFSTTYRLQDDGTTELQLTGPDDVSVRTAARGYVLGVGGDGAITRWNGLGVVSDRQRSVDTGEAWSIQSSTEAYAVAGRKLSVRDTNGWHVISEMPQGYGIQSWDVWAASKDDVFVVSQSAEAVRYHAGTWSIDYPPQNVPVRFRPWYVDGSSSDHVVIASVDQIRRWNGTTWSTDVTLPDFADALRDVAVFPTEIFVASAAGLYRESGGAWTLVPGTENHGYDHIAKRGNDLVATGFSGVATRHDGVWTVAAVQSGPVIYSVSLAPDGAIYGLASGQYGADRIARFTSGAGWSTITNTVSSYTPALFVDDTQISLLGGNGMVRRSR